MSELLQAIRDAGLPCSDDGSTLRYGYVEWEKGFRRARIERTGIRVVPVYPEGYPFSRVAIKPSDPIEVAEVKLYSVFFESPSDNPCHGLTAAEAVAKVMEWFR